MVYSTTEINDTGISMKASLPQTKFKKITDITCQSLDDAINKWLEDNPNVRVVSYSNVYDYYGDFSVLIEYIEVEE